MKKLFFIFLIVFFCFQSYAQSLGGEWRGTFYTDSDVILPGSSQPITLYFVMDQDSSYHIFSYSWGQDAAGKDTIVVCKVLYKKTAANSFYLEETEVLLPKNAPAVCFQNMNLTLRKAKGSMQLEGTWKSGEKCNHSGTIRFKKEN